MIHIYTGEGKGKTTAAFGLALRARGRGWPVEVVQFLKDGSSGEVAPARQAGIVVTACGREGLVDPRHPAEEDRRLAREGWELACRLIASGEYRMVILDEVLVAAAWGLVPEEELLALLDSRPAPELVLTGRGASSELMRRADLVSEVLAIKHYYHAGVPARPGIEF